MAQSSSITAELNVQPERTHFLEMIAKSPNYFGNIPGSELKPIFSKSNDTLFEEISCIGYNPYTTEMEAVFSIKQPFGYSGGLCMKGSFEYIRFYMDFHDGAGFIDEGSIAVNVHDIALEKDCKGGTIFPLKYAASLKAKHLKSNICSKPMLPSLKAILSWNHEPPAASPNWNPVWGNAMTKDVQIKPFFLIKTDEMHMDLSKYLSLTAVSPNMPAKDLAEISGFDINTLNPEAENPSVAELAKSYEIEKVPASRFAFKTVLNMIKYPASELTINDKEILKNLKIDTGKIIDGLSVAIPSKKPTLTSTTKNLNAWDLITTKNFWWLQ